jgi:KDO2-lipid IV(A) lauroyltransferase
MTPLGYVSAEWLARALPRRWADRIAVAIARAAFALHVPARRQLEANLAWLVEHEPALRPGPGSETRRIERQACAAFEHFALGVADFFRTPRSANGLLDGIEVRGRSHLEAAERTGRGVIVLSAHSGCWEWGAAYLAALGRDVHVVARPHRSPAVERFFAARRRRFRVARLIGRPLWIQASLALKRREWVALTGDRDAHGESAGGTPRTSVCAWVAALSRRTGALILPAVMLRLGNGRHAACFDRPLTPEACKDGGYREALRRLLGEHAEQWSAFEPLPEWLA